MLDAADIARALTRIAHEILERNKGADDLVLLGIPTRGVAAGRAGIAAADRRGRGRRGPGRLARRHDVPRRPAAAPGPRARAHRHPAGRHRRHASSSSSTTCSSPAAPIRAALDALGDLGRPRAVQLAVLVDRGHRELPIRADYVGKNLPTSLRETGAASARRRTTARDARR